MTFSEYYGGVMSRHGCGKVVVLCENASALLGHATALNEMGYFSVSLCSSPEELIKLFEAGKRFEYLIFDGFDLGVDAQSVKQIARYTAATSIITVSDVNSIQRKGVFLWAQQHKIPLLGVLQAPFRLPELQALMGDGVFSRASHPLQRDRATA
jgi:hypothetical protein